MSQPAAVMDEADVLGLDCVGQRGHDLRGPLERRDRSTQAHGTADAREQLDCWTGLARKSSAPASSAATMSSIEVWAVITITGRVAVSGSARSRRQISKPSMPGSDRSSSTICGAYSTIARRPISPLPSRGCHSRRARGRASAARAASARPRSPARARRWPQRWRESAMPVFRRLPGTPISSCCTTPNMAQAEYRRSLRARPEPADRVCHAQNTLKRPITQAPGCTKFLAGRLRGE